MVPEFTAVFTLFGPPRSDRASDAIQSSVAGSVAVDALGSHGLITLSVESTARLAPHAGGAHARNPAHGRGRRARERAPTRSYLDAASQITALLDAAGALDRDALASRRHVERRAILARLTFAGLRIGELCALRWRDVDLVRGWLHVGEAKTDAGRRRVRVRGALRDELLSVRGRHQEAAQADYVFATASGGRASENNVRNRVLGRPARTVDGEEKAGQGAIARANEQLEADGLAPLPEKLTPHSLRRTFCSLLYALDEDPGVVMDEMGHTEPALALRVYRQAMRRDGQEKNALRVLVEGCDPRLGIRPAGATRPCLERQEPRCPRGGGALAAIGRRRVGGRRSAFLLVRCRLGGS
jgi:integrase